MAALVSLLPKGVRGPGEESRISSSSSPLKLSPLPAWAGRGRPKRIRPAWAGRSLAIGCCWRRADVAGGGGAGGSAGHADEAPVLSLFTFSIAFPWLKELAVRAMELAGGERAGNELRERGPVLVTH